ncbi:unnamed protein product [Paramecium octaurelia]|uniref:Uncharacterized protein n=1 Tax=Paramecium octaurelia TaxID=43137 RepID=A0A8S1W039_PAROT|nr:unnamed protein product [Paramecium octaurelia]
MFFYLYDFFKEANENLRQQIVELTLNQNQKIKILNN